MIRSRPQNKMKLYQDTLPADKTRMPVIHLPKTIDKRLFGIDFTFGIVSAAETIAAEIRNLNRDAAAGQGIFLSGSTLGRSAEWLAYGASIAGDCINGVECRGYYGRTRKLRAVASTGRNTKVRKVMNLGAVMKKMTP